MQIDILALAGACAGLVLIMVVMALLWLRQYQRTGQALQSAELALQAHRQRAVEADKMAAELAEIQQTNLNNDRQLQRARALLEAKEAEQQRLAQQAESREQELSVVQVALSAAKEQLAEQAATSKEREASFARQLADFKASREQLKNEFEQLAQEVLEKKGQAFKLQSEDSIKQLLQPLQIDVKGFREKVESIHVEELKQRSALRQELIGLQELNRQITDKADALTSALQGQKKLQGNWGELMLENVLDSSGLRLGTDYTREKGFTDANGKQQRPDAIVYLPQEKHLIIDAKTSLAAYTRFVNAEDDDLRTAALAEHAAAVSARITELANKNYYNLPELNSPEVVIMFIPIESAYVEALRYDESLYQRAIEQNVLVATPTTLLTSLNIVRQLWRFEDQSKHSAELATRAAKFYDKLRLFLESMSRVGKGIDQAREHYDKALGQLSTGRGNLIKQAAEFNELGVSVTKELDAELVGKANLELPETSTKND
ncbi:DNA recombination protein RmuC [Umboniibacter marinipuniceus]|uniref:DNA recombination protein RmuC n=1 Tax=Umboniibacter marinipuniceus TaxID=569599 RepID=A0A3M0AEN8_9GAMM|nr:DNA recombination protein RmuC [Umboniibacter marinipuniceus]RMA77652.1 DNA recombination protein RmuC [Umboniibacter marinipuniceus]